MKNLFKYLMYLSFVFLAIALYRAHYLEIPLIKSFWYLTLAYFFYLVSYFFVTFSWQQLLEKASFIISIKEAFCSFSLTIFTKYIPGKVSSLIGPLSYINKERGYSLRLLSVLAVTDQLIVLWVALIFGVVGSFFVNNVKLYSLAIFFLWLLVTLAVFSRFFHNLTEKAVKKIFKKEITIPFLKFSSTLSVLPWYFGQWFFLCLAFYFFVGTLFPDAVQLKVLLVLPLASAFGMLAIIFPGGLGVREGFLTSFLVMIGFDLIVATTIAVSSRLWFISGEVLIFIAGLLAAKLRGDNQPDRCESVLHSGINDQH